jgi:tetraacyldisaccharide 4'-kinase
MNILSRALSAGYSQLAKLRVVSYQNGWSQQHHLKIPVISVGNLTFGGTGKTPVTEFLMKLLLEKGQRPGIACRSYKAKNNKVQKINSMADHAGDVGDEALLLARQFPQSPVYSGLRKWQVAEEISQRENIDTLILDDGFQHLKLHRDLDLVLLDACESPDNYFCFPAGRGREPWSALERADIILLTKCNLAGAENLKFHREQLKDRDVFEFSYAVRGFENLQGQVLSDLPRSQKLLLVSAIAKPQSFEALMKKRFPEAIIETLSYTDHYAFKASDIATIQARLKNGFDGVLVTEKDGVKLKDLKTAYELPLWQVQLELKPDFSVESLYAKMHSVLA